MSKSEVIFKISNNQLWAKKRTEADTEWKPYTQERVLEIVEDYYARCRELAKLQNRTKAINHAAVDYTIEFDSNGNVIE